MIVLLYQWDLSGFGQSSNKSESIEQAINPKNGSIVKLKKETIYFQSSKTLWDWIELVGLISTGMIPFVLYQLQHSQQKLAKQNEKFENELAKQNEKFENERAKKLSNEEALQAYFDRMSVLLLDKNLRTLPAGTPRQLEVLNVARAITLSILRRLNNDGKNKGSVIWFLIELELITEFKLNLSNANLDGADLQGANLSYAELNYSRFKGANLREVNFNKAKLSRTNFHKAKFSKTDLSSSILSHSDFRKAQLTYKSVNFAYAKLEGADFSDAKLQGVDFGSANLGGAKLIRADLTNANLGQANLADTDLDGAILIDVKYTIPAQIQSAKNWDKAIYSPALRKELGLPEIETTNQDNQ
ncbi:MAG: pentapeptide repeat-containing protein [Calothrix sp. C42_A2020_038]|nr:pentapeptide repeat-containing protein [Calothrix sp. C42_A2020_038]